MRQRMKADKTLFAPTIKHVPMSPASDRNASATCAEVWISVTRQHAILTLS